MNILFHNAISISIMPFCFPAMIAQRYSPPLQQRVRAFTARALLSVQMYL
jgi:hypothetical protein